MTGMVSAKLPGSIFLVRPIMGFALAMSFEEFIIFLHAISEWWESMRTKLVGRTVSKIVQLGQRLQRVSGRHRRESKG